eukprot:5355415-Pyramimonas_sp.AAC.1
MRHKEEVRTHILKEPKELTQKEPKQHPAFVALEEVCKLVTPPSQRTTLVIPGQQRCCSLPELTA